MRERPLKSGILSRIPQGSNNSNRQIEPIALTTIDGTIQGGLIQFLLHLPPLGGTILERRGTGMVRPESPAHVYPYER